MQTAKSTDTFPAVAKSVNKCESEIEGGGGGGVVVMERGSKGCDFVVLLKLLLIVLPFAVCSETL